MELDEHEQGERVRTWLRQNGGSLILGIALGLGLVFGWKWWQGRGETHQQEAAIQYQALADAVTAKDAAKVQAFASQLADKYADTAYASLARLRHAAFLQESGKTEEAIKVLQVAPAHEREDIAEIRQLRLARLWLVAGKPAEAAKIVDAMATTRRTRRNMDQVSGLAGGCPPASMSLSSTSWRVAAAWSRCVRAFS